MKIIEFEDKYPDWNMGFIAVNPMTATEKLIGYRMTLTFDIIKKKTYQMFHIPAEYFYQLMDHLIEKNSIVMSINDASIYCKYIDGSVRGVCLETQERVLIERLNTWHFRDDE